MICETKKEAARVAYFGAQKMDEQGYQYKEFWPFALQGGQLRGGGYTVRHGLTAYRVQDTEGAAKRTLTCTCPFFKDNAHYGTCKHCVRVEWLLQDTEAELEEQAREDALAIEAEARMSAECPTHGTVSDKYRWATS